MKKTAVIIILAMLLALCGCTVERVDLPDGSVQQEPEQDYVFIVNGVPAAMHSDASPVLEALGEPVKTFEEPSCATDDIDKVYIYGSIQLWLYPMDGGYRIYSVTLLNDTVETPEGVTIGDSLQQVIDAYGEEYVKDGVIYLYKTQNTELRFTVEDDTVTAVSYTAVLD